jgi:hypothetical protein
LVVVELPGRRKWAAMEATRFLELHHQILLLPVVGVVVVVVMVRATTEVLVVGQFFPALPV